MREWIEQLDLETLVKDCAGRFGCDDDQARDAVLDVLNALWLRAPSWEASFENRASVYVYVRISVLRHLAKTQQRVPKHDALDERALNAETPTPEQALMAMFQFQNTASLLERALQRVKRPPSLARELRQLVQRLVRRPEDYIHTRQQGPDTGRYTFRYSKLAQDMRWTRKRLYKRLDQLRALLLDRSENDKES